MKPRVFLVLVAALIWHLGAAPGHGADSPGASWSILSPRPSLDHSALAWDTRRNHLWLFGGEDFKGHRRGDLWMMDMNAPTRWRAVPGPGVFPSPRVKASLVYDSIADRLILFGGFGTDPDDDELRDIWMFPLGVPGTWEELTPWNDPGSQPLPRGYHGAFFDPVANRMIIAGGKNGTGCSGETWMLRLDVPQPAWEVFNLTGGRPGVCGDPPLMFYDARRDCGVFVQHYGEYWTLPIRTPATRGRPAEWTRIPLSGAVPWAGVLAYDSVTDRLLAPVPVRWGDGIDRVALHKATLEASEWSTSPVFEVSLPNTGRGMTTFDPKTGQFVFLPYYHNQDGETDFLSIADHTWTSVRPESWIPRNPSYIQRNYVYDSLRHRILVVGPREVWSFELDGEPAWRKLDVDFGAVPERTNGFSTIYDSQRDRLVLYGGSAALPGFVSRVYSDTYELKLQDAALRWSFVGFADSPDIFTQLSRHLAVYDPDGDRMIVYGGHSGTDVWEASFEGGGRWRRFPVLGEGPGRRGGSSVVYDPVRKAMVVFGGGFSMPDSEGVQRRHLFNDTWVLPLAGNRHTWRRQGEGEAPPPRSAHTAVYDSIRDRMIVFGGFKASVPQERGPNIEVEYDDVWAQSLAQPGLWHRIETGGFSIPPRQLHGAIYDPDNDRMVIMDGSESNETWELAFGCNPDRGNGDCVSTPVTSGTVPLKPAPAAPEGLRVAALHPNPSRGRLSLDLVLARDGMVEVAILDTQGRFIRSVFQGFRVAGPQAIDVNVEDMAGGVYFLKVKSGSETRVRKLVVR